MASSRSPGVAWLTVHAEVETVKHTGCCVSPSKQNKICAVLNGLDA